MGTAARVATAGPVLGGDVVVEATVAAEAPEIEGDLPAIFTKRWLPTVKFELTEAIVFDLVRLSLPGRSVSLPPPFFMAADAAFFSPRSAFLAALSRTPGQAAGTFISHFEWQE